MLHMTPPLAAVPLRPLAVVLAVEDGRVPPPGHAW